ncbi:hypothetical protein [Stenotrophomonas sp. 278]|uniref:hypothetical protein n=1 Tax=Stenotrophomonas sp. 278 TaxID=2479851 RepID=UPI000F68E41E|nr:hypothetical protein [Stenotrophomonas sp. 278]
MRFTVSVVLATALMGSPVIAVAAEHVYASLQLIQHDDAMQSGVESVTLQRVKVDAAAKGGRNVTVQPLWAEYQVMGHGKRRVTDLDQREPGVQPMLDDLASGFRTMVSAKDEAGVLEPVNPCVWEQAVTAMPEATQWQLSGENVLAMLPQQVPEQWQVGQTHRRTAKSRAHGTVAVEQKVVALTPTVAVLDFTVTGKALKGTGRQAVRRSDGMPVETRMSLHRDAVRGLPATTETAHVADLAYEPFLEPMTAEQYRQQVASVTDELARPPYSAPSGRPDDYAPSNETLDKLDAWMVSADAVPAFEKSLRFALLPDRDSGRTLLAIGAEARLGPASPVSSVLEPTLTVRPRSVTLLGRDGKPLPDLEAVRALSSFQMEGRHKALENSSSFPFRLPLNTTEQQRQALHRIRMTVDVEVHRWRGTEVIKPGEASRVNPSVRVSMPAPHRITLLNERVQPAAPEGIWTSVVPLDAQGQEIPTRHLAVGPFQKKVGDSELPLVWEFSTEPYRNEIAAERPIAALQLRHYGWETLRREWEFWRAGEDGKLIE